MSASSRFIRPRVPKRVVKAGPRDGSHSQTVVMMLSAKLAFPQSLRRSGATPMGWRLPAWPPTQPRSLYARRGSPTCTGDGGFQDRGSRHSVLACRDGPRPR